MVLLYMITEVTALPQKHVVFALIRHLELTGNSPERFSFLRANHSQNSLFTERPALADLKLLELRPLCQRFGILLIPSQ